MIVVHHLENSRSQRVLWMLEELSVPYELKQYARNPKTMLAPPELRAIHPLGKSPVITDGDQTLAESGAILEYLIDRYGKGRLQPKPADVVRYRYFLHYAEGSLMPVLLLKLIFDRIGSGPMPFFVRPIAKAIAKKAKGLLVDPQLPRHFDFIEGELGKSTWFAGDEMTAADIQMSFPLEAARARGGLDDKHPRMIAFLDRIHARPAYKRALERGGPYQLLS